MDTTLTASLEERLDDSTRQHVREIADSNGRNKAAAAGPVAQSRLASIVEDVLAKRLGQQALAKLAAHGGQVSAAWRELPQRMHLVANQTKLMMELVDDFRSGTYRKVPWHSIVVSAAAILYAASPADLIPDIVVGLGVLDDIAVAALAARVLRKDLKAYCQFKGYKLEDYFGAA